MMNAMRAADSMSNLVCDYNELRAHCRILERQLQALRQLRAADAARAAAIQEEIDEGVEYVLSCRREEKGDLQDKILILEEENINLKKELLELRYWVL